jgi:HK97 family phage major capsid protein
VPDVLQNSIINLQDQWGTARQQCQMVQMTSDTMAIPKRSSGPTAYWVGEGSTITASDAAFTRVHLTAKKLATITRITSELLEDSVVALADWIAQDAALALTEAEDSAWILGDGTSTYGGIYGIGGQFDANESLNGVYTAASGVDTFSEITPTDLAGVIGLLPQRAFSGRGARWLCSNLAKAHAFERLGQIGGGTNVITIGEGLQQTYSGYPIVINEKCPRAETAYNSSMIYFGNFDLGCVFGDRRQTTIQLLTELYAASDEVAVKVTERIAINFHEAGDDTNAGVVVALWGE